VLRVDRATPAEHADVWYPRLEQLVLRSRIAGIERVEFVQLGVTFA